MFASPYRRRRTVQRSLCVLSLALSLVSVSRGNLQRAHRFLKQLDGKARGRSCKLREILVEQWEDQAGLQLAEAQRQAMLASLQHGVLILTGGPGTGKTTVVRGMLEVLEKSS